MRLNIIIGLLIALIGIVLFTGTPTSDGVLAGASCNSGNCTDFDAVNTSAGYYVDDVEIINGSGNLEVPVDSFTQGGGTVTVSQGVSAVTLTEAQMLTSNVITFTASTTQGALTVTLPATSTMTTLLANDGDYREWVIINPFTAAATTTTIAAGTGIDLQEPDGQNVVIGINNFAWLTCFRKANTDVVCRIDETIPAD